MKQRPVALKSLVGSRNYNLHDDTSDRDYIVLTLPVFEDLYRGTIYTEKFDTKDGDESHLDIRKLPDLLWKSNPNFLEVLYSDHIELTGDPKINDLIMELFSMKSEISRMNLSYLYKACKGMYYTRYNKIEKGTKSTQHLVAKYGYDTKEALNCYRSLDIINRFASTDFGDFKKAITYSDKERENLLSIKYGMYTKDEFKKVIDDKVDEVYNLKSLYVDNDPNESTKSTVDEIAIEIVKIHLDDIVANKNAPFIQPGDIFYSPYYKSECIVTRFVDINNWWFALKPNALQSFMKVKPKEIKASSIPTKAQWIHITGSGGGQACQ